MRYGLIGCGRIARNHLKAVIENDLELKAVCDLIDEKMESLLATQGLESDEAIRRYTDYRMMLEKNPDLELVAIATESGNHAEIALACIDAGMHCIIEKPMALSLADADAIINAADRQGVKVEICHQNRFNQAVQRLRRARDDGRFGRLSHGSIHVRWNRNRDYYDQAPWRGTWTQDGGCLMNQCIHGIDLLQWLMDAKPVRVFGQTRQRFHDYLEAEDLGMAVIAFDDGSLATVEGAVNVFPKNLEETLYLFGERGAVKLGGKSTNRIDVWQFADERPGDEEACSLDEATVNVYGNGHTPLYADMIAAIEEDRTPAIDARAGRRALELILAIYKSQKTGEPVDLPLTDFSTLDMIGTFDHD